MTLVCHVCFKSHGTWQYLNVCSNPNSKTGKKIRDLKEFNMKNNENLRLFLQGDYVGHFPT